MKKLISFIATAYGFNAFAQSPSHFDSFIPKGWKIIQRANGDLNHDQLVDTALIIEDTDPTHFQKNEFLGESVLNLNARRLLILFQQPNKQYLLNSSKDDFIPPPNDFESPCLEDPLAEAEPMSIGKGVLKVELRYWYSCGTWYSSKEKYAFRYDGQRFRLIGQDSYSYHRASGDEEEHSINYLTGKQSTTTGGNISGEKRAKTHWKPLKENKAIFLDALNIKDDASH